MSFKLTDFITVSNTGVTTFGSDGVLINRTGADSYLFFQNSGTNRGAIYGGDPSGNAGLRFYIANNSDPSIVLTSVGNVGIGTTSPTNLSSQTSLTIQGASVSRLDLLGASGAGGGVVFGTATAFTVQGNYGIPLVLDAGDTADMNFNIGGSSKLTIASGGAATFSSSVTADQGIFNSTANTYAGGSLILRDLNGANPMYLTSVVGNLAISNGGAADHLTISSAGSLLVKTNATSGISIGDIGLDNGALRGGVIRARNAADNAYKALIYLDQNDAVQVGTAATGLNISSGGDVTLKGNGTTSALIFDQTSYARIINKVNQTLYVDSDVHEFRTNAGVARLTISSGGSATFYKSISSKR